jgi:hypothetical protein
MEHLFTICAEGGPLLISSLSVARLWKGTEKPSDYEVLCSDFDANASTQGLIIKNESGIVLAWEMAGAGVADVYKHELGKITIIRVWSDDENLGLIGKIVEEPAMQPVFLGLLPVVNNALAIMWAAESGGRLPRKLENRFERVVGGTAIESSVFAVQVDVNAFECYHEELRIMGVQARRLTLIPFQA